MSKFQMLKLMFNASHKRRSYCVKQLLQGRKRTEKERKHYSSEIIKFKYCTKQNCCNDQNFQTSSSLNKINTKQNNQLGSCHLLRWRRNTMQKKYKSEIPMILISL